jgi:hypothetical protein
MMAEKSVASGLAMDGTAGAIPQLSSQNSAVDRSSPLKRWINCRTIAAWFRKLVSEVGERLRTHGLALSL